MGLPALASLADLADWIGEEIQLGSGDAKRAEAALRSASTLVRAETDNDWIDTNGHLLTRIPDAIGQVVVSAAGRHYLNPEALTGENIDDFQSYRKVDEVGVYLTAAEKQMLAAAVGGSTRRTAGLSTLGTYRRRHQRRDPDAEDAAQWTPIGGPPDNM